MDECKLIKEFYADVPEPTQASGYRAAAVLGRAISSEQETASEHRKPSRTNGRPTQRLRHRLIVGLSVVGGAVVVAMTILAVMFLAGGNNPVSPSPAYAAEVQKAAADTAAAGQSGVITTTVLFRDLSSEDSAGAVQTQFTDTFSWYGDNCDLLEKDAAGGRELRYVDGHYYDNADGQWFHYTAYDNGGGDASFDPAGLVDQYRSDLVGSGLVDFVTKVSGLTKTTTSAGETTYRGTLAAGQFSGHDLGLLGDPFASKPLRVAEYREPNSLVSLEVLVGTDGLLKAATLTGEVGDIGFTCKVTYDELGSASPIVAPEATHTITTDKPAS